MTLVAGVDCSTQATKVVLVDVDDGRVVAQGRADHEVTGTGGARETDPVVWRDALAAALAATGLAGQVAAISVAGQQHGLVITDDAGAPLRPAMLWNDTRSAPEADELVAALGGPEVWARRVGVVPVASVTATKWAWLRRHEPEIAAAARTVCLPHDWLTGQLTGRSTTDRGDASGTGWWSGHRERLEPDVLALEEVDLDPSLLPEIVGPDRTAGEVSPAAAARYGLPAGIPVGPGTGDNMGAALGLGLDPGVPVVSLGTSGTAYVVSERCAADPSGTVAGFADATGRFLPLACTLNCTLAVDRVAQWLGRDRDAVADATGVVTLPYLDGERTPDLPHASGLTVGLRHDTDPGEILLAAYEGAVAALATALDALDEHSSGLARDAPVVLIGGGARGPTWRRTVGRLTGRPLRVPGEAEHVAIGAAAQAAAAVTGERAETLARRWGHGHGEELEPLPRDEDVLARISAVQRGAGDLWEAVG